MVILNSNPGKLTETAMIGPAESASRSFRRRAQHGIMATSLLNMRKPESGNIG